MALEATFFIEPFFVERYFIRGGPLEITGRGGSKNFSADVFFFLMQIVCMNFFFDVKALHHFFFDSTSFNTLLQFTCRIFFFFFCNFPLQEFFLGIVTPPFRDF